MKKFISVIMCVILTVCLFSGCSEKTENNENSELLEYTIDSHYTAAGESIIRAYKKVCEAVEKGETEVKFNYSMTDGVNQLFYTCYPLNILVSDIKRLDDNSGVQIKYVNDIDTHKELVSSFKDKLNSLKNECGFGEVGTNQYIFNVYSYISKNVTIDSSVTNTFDTIMNLKGVEASVNSMFEYLVLQGGGNACHAVNFSGASTMISTAKFNGEWYYFDPASEARENKGEALTRFAMNDDTVKKFYSSNEFTYTDQTDLLPVSDDKYTVLADSLSYKIDKSEVNVVLSNSDKVFMINFV
ncbi:MAG: hypothetical protein NC213_06365 [Acetobacter sp.]|nr:hypothetical protein [Bacteroides sp.]MCM1341349.1 hypothetical protein [Acetobacter sp.]MCM1433441.1 hypothetical protein [Clostridiales bacterium]